MSFSLRFTFKRVSSPSCWKTIAEYKGQGNNIRIVMHISSLKIEMPWQLNHFGEDKLIITIFCRATTLKTNEKNLVL